MFMLTFVCGAVGAVGLPTTARGQEEPQQIQRQQRERECRQDPGERKCRQGPDEWERRQNPDERAAGEEIAEDDKDASVADGATLLLVPSRLQAAPGSRIRLTLSILGAHDVRRVPVTIRFDPNVIELVSVGLGSAWKNRPQPVLMHDESRPGELVVGIGQLDKNKSGISGVAELLELEFVALAPGNAGIVLERFAAIGAGARAQTTTALATNIVVR